MLSDLIFVMILVYFAGLSGLIYAGVLTLKTEKAWIACLSATLFILCVITLYASTLAFIEEVQLLQLNYFLL